MKVHKKHIFVSPLCVVERTVCWTNKIVLANQDCVDCLRSVAGQTEVIVATAGEHLM